MWIKELLKGMKEKITELVIFHDNPSAITIFKNTMIHTKTKNTSIKYNYFRKLVQDNNKGWIGLCEYKGT